ncbi:MAG: hypothetical protein KIT68_07365 [Phycisphaeraceae bacterium]|nr:hypothetical protein [Phycisphaeraceae bacterium]
MLTQFFRAAALATAFGGASALADTHSFPPVSLSPGDSLSSITLTGAPANNWRSISISMDWTSGPGDPYSEEAQIFFTDTAASGGAIPAQTVYYGFGRTFTNGQPNGFPIQLVLAFDLDRVFPGGDLVLSGQQLYPGSSANWTNIMVTLSTDGPTPVTPPSATDLGTLCGTDDVVVSNVVLGATAPQWYTFTLDSTLSNATGYYLDIDTEGSASGDTFMALYAANGDLLYWDDDGGTGLLSQLSFGSNAPIREPAGVPASGPAPARQPYDGRNGPLAPGTYYLGLCRYSAATFNLLGRDFSFTTNATGANPTVQLTFRKNLPACAGAACNPADVATEGSSQPFVDGPDGFITGTDFDVFVQAFFQEVRRPEPSGPFIADLTDGDGTGGPDGFITGSDFDYFIVKFFEGCP